MISIGSFTFLSRIPDLNHEPMSPKGLVLMLLFNVELYFGIFGILSARKPSPGKLIMVLGIIMLLIHVGSSILAIRRGAFGAILMLGLILKMCYTFGGYELYQGQKDDTDSESI